MYGIRLQLPQGRGINYRFRDSVHDAVIHALCDAGAKPEQVIGQGAEGYTFALRDRRIGDQLTSRHLILRTSSSSLGTVLARLDPGAVRSACRTTGDTVSFESAE